MMPRRRATASVASSLASSTSSTVSTTSRGISRKHSSSVFSARYAGITTTIFCPCSMESLSGDALLRWFGTRQMIHGLVTAEVVSTLAPRAIPVFNLARRRSNSDNALQQLRIPDLFSPAIARGLLSAWAQGDMGRRLAGRGVTVLLRLVEPEVSAADPGKHRLQLLYRPRAAPSLRPRQGAARIRRRRQPGLARRVQVRRLCGSQRRRPDRPADGAAAYCLAAGHQRLHLHPDRVSGRCL